MAQSASDFLYVDALIDKQRCMSVPEVVYADVGQACGFGKSCVFVLYAAIPQTADAAAYPKIIGKRWVSLLAALMLVEDIY